MITLLTQHRQTGGGQRCHGDNHIGKFALQKRGGRRNQRINKTLNCWRSKRTSFDVGAHVKGHIATSHSLLQAVTGPTWCERTTWLEVISCSPPFFPTKPVNCGSLGSCTRGGALAAQSSSRFDKVVLDFEEGPGSATFQPKA